MPELPEVESIRLQLEKFILGEKIIGITVNYSKTFKGDKKLVLNARIVKLRRFGKLLCLDLSNKYSILIHVKLSGQLIYKGKKLKRTVNSKKIIGGVPGKHTHVIFKLSKNQILYFNDVRKFGWIDVTLTNSVEDYPFVKKLGPEPLKDLTKKVFSDITAKSKKKIKELIMDQSKISGVGNIYANEALFLAGVDPRKTANKLEEKEINKLYNSIIKVLKKGIKYKGASELSYITPDGNEGDFQNHTMVYGRKEKLCQKCKKAKIIKIKLGGRGTYFCPRCQKQKSTIK